MKTKESEKRDEYLDLARELKKLWNMKVTVIPVVVDALGTIPKGIGKETGRLRNKRGVVDGMFFVTTWNDGVFSRLFSTTNNTKNMNNADKRNVMPTRMLKQINFIYI